jgi:hypothetical protein
MGHPKTLPEHYYEVNFFSDGGIKRVADFTGKKYDLLAHTYDHQNLHQAFKINSFIVLNA